jgi:hypothetical protein
LRQRKAAIFIIYIAHYYLYGRFVPSKMILFGETAVRKATAEFMAHYHSERNHQGLANALICPEREHAGGKGKVQRRERLGGLLNYYYRQAA